MENKIEEKELQEKSKQLGNQYVYSMLDPNSSFIQYGLTKREYFAGLAMQGLLSNESGGMTEGNSRTFSPYGISKLALQHADALLEQLSTE